MSFFGDLAAAAESLRASRDFVLRAVQRHGGALKASRFREDRSFLLEAAKRNGGVLKFVGSTFQATGMPLGRWWCGL